MEKKKVVVFQGDPGTIDLTREEMVAEWEKTLGAVPQIGEYRIIDPKKKRLGFEDYSAGIGDADAALAIIPPSSFPESV